MQLKFEASADFRKNDTSRVLDHFRKNKLHICNICELLNKFII